MKARYFRYLFENVPNGIIQWGYIEDSRVEKKAYYVYLSENSQKSVNAETSRSTADALLHLPDEEIDILVLGEFGIFDLMNLFKILNSRKVHSVVLPYVMPVSRQLLADSFPFPDDVREFILNPYQILEQMGVQEIHCLYGNGKALETNLEEIGSGAFFEAADEDVLRQIEQLEGQYLSVEKAGYVAACDWLFYFGCFGTQMEPDVFATVTMYAGPLHDAPSLVDSVFTKKVFSKELECMRSTQAGKCWCDLRCMRYQDHTVLKQHTKSEREESCFGILLLGNLNLKNFMKELMSRYQALEKRIRILTIPDGADYEKWNCEFPAMFAGSDFRYWVAAMNRGSSEEVLKDILFGSAYHYPVQINAEYGSCFSGYLVDKKESE